MKILHIYPNTRLSCDGFRIICALLRNEGHQLQIVTIPKRPPATISLDELQQLGEMSMGAELVMMSVYSVHEYHAIAITEHLRKLRPDRLIIWGGPHCIGAPEKSLKYADGVCYSEGDNAVPRFVKLLEAGDNAYRQTPNMAFRTGDSIQINPLIPLVEDLDSLPFSDYSFENEWVLDKTLIPLTAEVFGKYSPKSLFKTPTIFILSSRGCPHHCSYCNNIRYLKMYGHIKIRRQSVARLMDELKYMLRCLPDTKYICFGDDDFFARPEDEIREIVEDYKVTIGLPCGMSMSANTYSEPKFKEVLKLDDAIVEMGVQTGSKRVLEEVFQRTLPLPKIKIIINELLPLLKNSHTRLLCNFIVDNPYETESDILATYKFIAHLHERILVNMKALSFFPGSSLYERALKDHFISEDDIYLSRDFSSRKIKYQQNYLMLLLLMWESFSFSRRFPVWLIMLPATKPFVFMMKLVPLKLMVWMIKKIPVYLRKISKK